MADHPAGVSGGNGLDTKAIICLFFLFVSSLGETYYPDVMVINNMVTKANWLVVGDALGNILAGIVPTKEGFFEIPCKYALVPAICNLSAKAFLLGGIALASAQTKAILYNSCIVWSAVIAKCMLGRSLSYGQWAGVFVLVVGCTIKIDFKNGFGGDDLETLLGILFILIGCILHSLTNVVVEKYIRKYSIPPAKLCCLIGIINMLIWLLIIASGFIIPEMVGTGEEARWVYTRQDLSVATMWHTDPLGRVSMSNFWALVGFVVSSAVHAIAFFTLLGSIGVVSCGVMKGLTTAGYVTISAALFCSVDKKYCPHLDTVMSAVTCVLGVLMYSYATKLASDSSPREPLIAVEVTGKVEGRRSQTEMAGKMPVQVQTV